MRGLVPVTGPLPVTFPLPNPGDLFSLKPGSITLGSMNSKPAAVGASSDLSTAIAGARAAASQFSKNAPTRIQNSHQIVQSVEGTTSTAVKFNEENIPSKLNELTGSNKHRCSDDNHAAILPSQVLFF